MAVMPTFSPAKTQSMELRQVGVVVTSQKSGASALICEAKVCHVYNTGNSYA